MMKFNSKKPITLTASGNKRKFVVFLLIFIVIALLIRIFKPITESVAKVFGYDPKSVKTGTKPIIDKVSEAAGGAALMGIGVLLLTMAAPLAATPVGWVFIAIGLVLAVTGFIYTSSAFNLDVKEKLEGKPKNKPEDKGTFVDPVLGDANYSYDMSGEGMNY